MLLPVQDVDRRERFPSVFAPTGPENGPAGALAIQIRTFQQAFSSLGVGRAALRARVRSGCGSCWALPKPAASACYQHELYRTAFTSACRRHARPAPNSSLSSRSLVFGWQASLNSRPAERSSDMSRSIRRAPAHSALPPSLQCPLRRWSGRHDDPSWQGVLLYCTPCPLLSCKLLNIRSYQK